MTAGASEIRWQVVSGAEPDADVVDAWDRLAVELGLPYCAPGWMLSWANAAAGPGALRIGVARRGEGIVGILPLIGRPGGPGGAERYELLGSEIAYRIEPLAKPAERDVVAAAIAGLLAELDPPVGELALHGIDPEPGWGEAIAAAWPAKLCPRTVREKELHAPYLEFGTEASYDGWLGTKSRHFRKRAWGDRRKFERHGELRIATTAPELGRAIEAFVGLHLGRWGERSRLGFASMPEQLSAASDRLGPERMRASTALVGGEIVAVDIFVRAGDVAAAWNGGWSESHRPLRPGFVTLLAGIEDAIESGVTEVDLGPGAHPWKERLATREATVVSERLIPERR